IGCAADAADDASLMRLQLQLEQRGVERGEHGEIAAAGTPIRMDPAAVSLFRELAGFSGGGRCSWRVHINQRSEGRGRKSEVMPAPRAVGLIVLFCRLVVPSLL